MPNSWQLPNSPSTNLVEWILMGMLFWSKVRSKPWLGLLGNLSAVMATAAAFGLAMYLGIEFIGINLAAPFLMIGKSISYFNNCYPIRPTQLVICDRNNSDSTNFLFVLYYPVAKSKIWTLVRNRGKIFSQISRLQRKFLIK